MYRKGDSFVNSYRGLVEWQTRPGVGPGEGNSGSCGITSRTFDSFNPDFLYTDKNRIFIMLMRDGLEMVPARSHKPYHGGSNPPPATNAPLLSTKRNYYVCHCILYAW